MKTRNPTNETRTDSHPKKKCQVRTEPEKKIKTRTRTEPDFLLPDTSLAPSLLFLLADHPFPEETILSLSLVKSGRDSKLFKKGCALKRSKSNADKGNIQNRQMVSQWARKFKKVQAKKLVKSNKSILRIIFLTKFHFW